MHLTKAEKIFIHRRREGLTQEDAARIMAVTLAAYKVYEKTGNKFHLPYGQTPGTYRTPKLGRLKGHERCAIMRKRNPHITQQVIANQLGMCRNWIGLMERGDAPSKALEGFWSV